MLGLSKLSNILVFSSKFTNLSSNSHFPFQTQKATLAVSSTTTSNFCNICNFHHQFSFLPSFQESLVEKIPPIFFSFYRKIMEGYPQILNMIHKGYLPRDNKRSHEVSEERKLELKLGPPGETNSFLSPHKRGFQEFAIEGKTGEGKWMKNSTSDQSNQENKKLPFSEEPNTKVCFCPWASSSFPQACNFSMEQIQCQEKKTCSTPQNTSQKRIALGPVVGWPPVRSSFRKNIVTNNSSKLGPESSTTKNIQMVKESGENVENNLFVKINMDGIPIGRKIDLKAYDSYEKLSSAVDQLFSGLLAAQGDSYGTVINKKNMEKMKVIKEGLLDGRGEFTLVYEDNEGDRMLVGDVPWNMFIASAKRLRVLKRSELSALHISSCKLARAPLNSAAQDPTV